jgi:serine/threonine protein kinase
VFARKLFRPFGNITDEHTTNELRVVKKLFENGHHDNIVEVYKYGQLLNGPFLYIDMEVCALNLENFIQRQWTIEIYTHLPYLTVDLPPRLRAAQIWNIMEDIIRGLEYVHGLHEVHRDMKPRNGIITVVCR